MKTITILREDKQLGPYSVEEASFLLSQGFVSAEELAWAPGLEAWVPLGSILTPHLLPAPQPLAFPPTPLPSAIQRPAVVQAAPASSSMRGIRLWDIMWCIIGIIVLWNFGLESIVVPVGSVAGLVLAYLGFSAIPPVRRAFYAVMPSSKAVIAEIGYAVLALFLAFLSLMLWEPLFTFRSYIFWHKVADGPVALWVLDTCLFGYGFFMSRRVAQAS